MNSTKSFLAFAALFSPFLVFVPSRPAMAEVECRTLSLGADITSENQINGGDGCYMTPDGYTVKAYKLGLCPTGVNPLSSTTFDHSSCSIIWENSNGEEANLVDDNGNPATFTLNETNATKPPNGTYTSAFIVIDPTVKLKATLQLDNESWVTTTDYESSQTTEVATSLQWSLGSKTQASADFSEIRTGKLEITESPFVACHDTDIIVDGKTIDAAFLNSDQQTVSSLTGITTTEGSQDATCLSAAFIVGVQELATPITITDSTESANISFLTTHNGAWLESYDYGSQGTPDIKILWDIGPFSLDMTVN